MATTATDKQSAGFVHCLHKGGEEAIEVRVGETAVAKGSGTLLASGVGSCVVVTLYDPKHIVAALAHALLPSSPHRRDEESSARDAKYVDAAIDVMLERMCACGARKKNLEAKIAGGANMFAEFQSNVGRDNVAAAKGKLEAEGIELAGESTGGSVGRSVEFCVASGIVTAKPRF